MATSCSFTVNSGNTHSMIGILRSGLQLRTSENCGTTCVRGTQLRQKGNRRYLVRGFALLAMGLLPLPAVADIAGDEDRLFHDMLVAPDFRAFHRKYGRYPTTWLELGVRMGCTGYHIRDPKYLPKPSEAVVWKPDNCQLAYKIQFADKRGFRVVALARGHVVSINDTFRVKYLKTPYHSHEPPECPPLWAC